MAVLAKPGYCDSHRAVTHREYGRARRSFDTEVGFYQSKSWRLLRAGFLRMHPLCEVCAKLGKETPAVVADHIQPIKDGGGRFDPSNLQALCVSCHNRKTAQETARRSPRGVGGLNL